MATALLPPREARATAKLMPCQSPSPGISCFSHVTPSRSPVVTGRSGAGTADSATSAAVWMRKTFRWASARTVAFGTPPSAPATWATARRMSSRAGQLGGAVTVRSTGSLPFGPSKTTLSKRFSARFPSSVHV